MAGAAEATRRANYFFTDVLRCRFWDGARPAGGPTAASGTPDVDAPDFIEIGVAADGRIAQVLAVGHGRRDAASRAG